MSSARQRPLGPLQPIQAFHRCMAKCPPQRAFGWGPGQSGRRRITDVGLCVPTNRFVRPSTSGIGTSCTEAFSPPSYHLRIVQDPPPLLPIGGLAEPLARHVHERHRVRHRQARVSQSGTVEFANGVLLWRHSISAHRERIQTNPPDLLVRADLRALPISYRRGLETGASPHEPN